MMTCVLVASIALLGCGEKLEELNSDTFIENLQDTRWSNGCFPIEDDNVVMAYNTSLIIIDTDLITTNEVEVYDAIDTNCDTVLSTINYTTQLEVLELMTTDKSIRTQC